MAERNSFWEGDITQVNPAIWRDGEETGQTRGSKEMLRGKGALENQLGFKIEP